MINDCINYADQMKQYQKLIVHYINKGKHDIALDKLCSIESAEQRYYEMTKYMSIMIKKAAHKTFNCLENPENFRKIDIPPLMPALMDCPPEARERARQYVESHCINARRCNESSVHNMCFYLYSQSDNSNELVGFLKKKELDHNQGLPIYFDVTYALNVVKQNQNQFEKELKELRDRPDNDREK
jgi:hypothetical protein